MDNRGNIVIYQTKDGKTSIDVKLENETVWLTQAQMADLFQKDRTVIGRHINIGKESWSVISRVQNSHMWVAIMTNNTFVALTLMIAESRTEEKDVMVKVVINLINKNN